MRAFTAIILTLAAVATAAPSTGSDGVNVLQVRQECTYRCGCSTVNDIPGDTEGCCATAGGSYDGNLCNGLTIPSHDTFSVCCNRNAVCFRSSPQCPP